MKKLKETLSCVCFQIKKKFFNRKNSDIFHKCNETFAFTQFLSESDKEAKEYLENYTSMTRWQTV